MPYPQLNRFDVQMQPLAARSNKKRIEQDHVAPHAQPRPLSPAAAQVVADTAERIRAARARQRPVMLTFGAHAIKNGLGPVLRQLVQGGWLTHLATNGAGIIHDWEFAYQGQSCEDVAAMVREGRFGNWEETGFFINLAIVVGAYEGRGYGESVGAMISRDGLNLPSAAQLEAEIGAQASADPAQTAAAADLLTVVRRFALAPGWRPIPHPWKPYSIQAAAHDAGVPLTGHPMIGHDIIYNHPMNLCAAIGRAAERDFLTFAESVSRLEDGVYLSIGSAVMSPMVFEKSLSMAQNLALQRGQRIERHFLLISDLAESNWDWSQGEPPEDNPSYYLRYNKSFSRMGGTMRYVQADNRDLLLTLLHLLTAGTA